MTWLIANFTMKKGQKRGTDMNEIGQKWMKNGENLKINIITE